MAASFFRNGDFGCPDARIQISRECLALKETPKVFFRRLCTLGLLVGFFISAGSSAEARASENGTGSRSRSSRSRKTGKTAGKNAFTQSTHLKRLFTRKWTSKKLPNKATNRFVPPPPPPFLFINSLDFSLRQL